MIQYAPPESQHLPGVFMRQPYILFTAFCTAVGSYPAARKRLTRSWPLPHLPAQTSRASCSTDFPPDAAVFTPSFWLTRFWMTFGSYPAARSLFDRSVPFPHLPLITSSAIWSLDFLAGAVDAPPYYVTSSNKIKNDSTAMA